MADIEFLTLSSRLRIVRENEKSIYSISAFLYQFSCEIHIGKFPLATASLPINVFSTTDPRSFEPMLKCTLFTKEGSRLPAILSGAF